MARAILVLVLLVSLAAPALAADPGWPRIHKVGADQLTVFQPQIEAWEGYQTLRFRAALAVTLDGRTEPVYGFVAGKATTLVNTTERSVFVSSPVYEELKFPNASADDTARCLAVARQVVDPNKTWELSLDRVLSSLRDSTSQARSADVSLEPPPIYYADHASLLVVLLGPAAFKPVQGTSLLFATNTNWPLLMDPAGGRYYLLDEGSWLTAPDLVKGPWTAATTLPADLYRMPTDGGWDRVRQNVPGHLPAVLPTVFVTERPAELIVTDGDPQLVSVPGTNLFYVPNTSSDLFLDFTTGTYYFLTAGRWFSARSLSGPWAAATRSLPADFVRIPSDGPKGHVLASVAGTPQAEQAVLLATIPTTAKVDRAKTTIAVTWDGAPRFAPVEGAQGVSVGSNSTDVVFLVAGAYYCCRDGMWFTAAQPTGPWSVATQVPAAIQTIPPTSPYYNVTYVTVYDVTPTTVTVGYTAGYTGAYVAAGLVLFGAGLWVGAAWDGWATPYFAWHYPPSWYAYGSAVRYSYNDGAFVRGASYYGPYGGAGYQARYNPSTGTWARGAAVYGPYGGAGAASAWNPWTGATARGAYAYGPNGAVGAAGGYNPTTGRGAATYQHSTPYGSWGQSVVTSGDSWARTAHASNAWGTTGAWQTSAGGAGAVHTGANGNAGVAKTASGNVYAGKDGNVYKYEPGSGWQKNTGSGWEDPGWQRPTPQQQTQRMTQSPSTWDRSGWSGGDTERNLSGDAWGRNYSNTRESTGGWGGGSRWGGGGGGGGGGGRGRWR